MINYHTKTRKRHVRTRYALIVALAAFFMFGPGAATASVTGLPLDENGYTIFTPSADTRIVYVSSSEGSDANDGLSPDTPVQTLAHARSLLRYGYPDWMLLKKGDEWIEESIGELSCCNTDTALEGRSATEPMLIGSYGTGDRPLLKVAGTPLRTLGREYGGNYIALVGLEFYAYKRDPDSPDYDPTDANNHSVYLLDKSFDWFLIEDNKFNFLSFSSQDQAQNGMRNLTIRRNVFVDAYSNNSHAQCIFTSRQQNLVLEENVFDHCGWNDQVAGAHSTIFNRSAYLATGDGNTVYRGNIDANGASGGVQNRTGGTVEDNLFLQTPIAIVIGSSQNPAQNVPAVVRNNVILGSRDISTQAQSTGITMASYEEGGGYGPSYLENVEVYDNIIAHVTDGTGNISGITMGGDGEYRNVNVFDNIVYNWAPPVWDSPTDHRANAVTLNLTGNTVVDSAFYDNVLQQPNGGYVMRSRSLSTDNIPLAVHSNAYYSAEEEPPATWSQGWFSLFSSNSVNRSTWQAEAGDADSEYRAATFTDPDRTIDTYMDHIGIGGGYDEFMRRARLQSSDTYDERFTAAAVNSYIREGFTLGNTRTVQNKGAEVSNRTHRLTLSQKTANMTSLVARSEAELMEEEDYQYPLGLYEFEAEVASGTSATVTIAFDSVYDTSEWEFRKYAGSSYLDISDRVTYAVVDGVTTASYEVTDNGPLDLDDRLGYIRDPAGPAVTTVPETETSRSGSSATRVGQRGTSKKIVDARESSEQTARSEAYIVTENLNVRSTPGGNVIKLAPLSSRVVKLSSEPISQAGYRWSQVQLPDGTQGYVADQFLLPDNTSGAQSRVRAMENLNVRATPAGTLIQEVPVNSEGVKLSESIVEQDGYFWLRVKFDNGITGYVASGYLQTVAAALDRTQILEQIKALVQKVQMLQAQLEAANKQ